MLSSGPMTSWSRSDPIGLAGGIKLYGYVENSLSWIDPFGLTSISYAEDAKALGYESVNKQCSQGQPIFKKGRSKCEDIR